MINESDRTECYLYQIAGTDWIFGPKGNTKLIGHMNGLSEFVVGCRNPNQCVLKVLMGVGNDAYIPAFSGEKSLDYRAKHEIQSLEMSLIESAEKAEEDGLHDEAREYREELADIRKHLKRDFISARVVKRLHGGEIMRSLAHRTRQRKGRALDKLRKAGFHEQAEDIKRSFKVSDRNIVFLKDASAYKWILKADE